MLKSVFVYLLGALGVIGGAMLGPTIFHPNPVAGEGQCGMWVIPAMALGGFLGGMFVSMVGLVLVRFFNTSVLDEPDEFETDDSADWPDKET